MEFPLHSRFRKYTPHSQIPDTVSRTPTMVEMVEVEMAEVEMVEVEMVESMAALKVVISEDHCT